MAAACPCLRHISQAAFHVPCSNRSRTMQFRVFSMKNTFQLCSTNVSGRIRRVLSRNFVLRLNMKPHPHGAAGFRRGDCRLILSIIPVSGCSTFPCWERPIASSARIHLLWPMSQRISISHRCGCMTQKTFRRPTMQMN